MEILRLERGSGRWDELIRYAQGCPWVAGQHLADMMRKNAFTDWESVFAAVSDDRIIGFCTFLKTDYYPDNRYSPWISSIFVDEACRGRRISGRMIDAVVAYAREQGFSKVYIPTDMTGFYEKYGFIRIDRLRNYGGDVDNILMKAI